ncbi:hypothetical protein [Hamadaea tsunoensis]|uniref:hypothetical protein n=1 Tax=Hamadaea tsunoensis TaxID=53368 RepID=UPI00040DB73E|nr:hypothetical protein [Hamadaea tsunoensis]
MPDLGTRRKLGVALVAAAGLAAGFLVIVLVVRHPGVTAAGTSPSPATIDSTAPSSQANATPSPGTSAPASPGSESDPRVHSVRGNLCAAVDFTLADPFGGSQAPPAGDHSDKTGYVAYTCDRHADGVRLTVSALVFARADAATARYADTTAHPPANVDTAAIPALGEAATGFTAPTGLAMIWVRDGNLVLGVRLDVPGGQPAVLAAAAQHIAQTALSRLSG